ncbi:barstar family protein [Streptomyces sp. NRRL F-5053]|uniref:barstar family protein n=1 Tax=Streptomyces sp. NRRL F-5053 TaxID=1463854 RepID=UPI0004C52E2E|nr:barstar family protein [Streptomyces sp. NRRL F-5053]
MAEDEATAPDPLIVDLRTVRSPEELQEVLQRQLCFPDFYGKNWNAFWDTITGLVELPYDVTFSGWSAFSSALPDEAQRLRGLLDDYLAEYGQFFTRPRAVHYR